MRVDCKTIDGLMEGLPREIAILRGTLTEMKDASEPNREADYWDERHEIRSQLETLQNTEL